MDFWWIAIPVVLVINVAWWKFAAGRTHRDAMVSFDAFVRAQVSEPVEALAPVQPGGSVGEQARDEWKGAYRTILARLATGAAVTLPGDPSEQPPMAALALGRTQLHLVPWRFADDGISYEAYGTVVSLPRTGIHASSRHGALTIQLTITSGADVLDLELVRDPNGVSGAFVEQLCREFPT